MKSKLDKKIYERIPIMYQGTVKDLIDETLKEIKTKLRVLYRDSKEINIHCLRDGIKEILEEI